MPVAAVAAVVGAAAMTAGTIGSIKQQKKANKLLKQQYKFERQMATNRAAKERRDLIRAGRLTAATMAQTAANSGGAELSSVALGAMGSIRSQINANLSFLDTNQKLADQAGLAASKAASAQRTAAMWGDVTAVGKQVFNLAGGKDAIGTLFQRSGG